MTPAIGKDFIRFNDQLNQGMGVEPVQPGTHSIQHSLRSPGSDPEGQSEGDSLRTGQKGLDQRIPGGTQVHVFDKTILRRGEHRHLGRIELNPQAVFRRDHGEFKIIHIHPGRSRHLVGWKILVTDPRFPCPFPQSCSGQETQGIEFQIFRQIQLQEKIKGAQKIRDRISRQPHDHPGLRPDLHVFQ